MRPLLHALLVALPLAAHAQAIGVSHTGYLLGAADVPVEGVTQLTFSIWNDPASGAAVWTSDACSVTVRAGYYATVLGTTCTGASPITPTLLPAGTPRWLEVHVGGVTLTPRQLLATSVTAFDAARLGGHDAAEFVRATQLGAGGDVDVDASRLTTGTLPDARLSNHVARLDLPVLQAFSGDVSAPAFVGDGSQLTGVNALKLGGKTLAELQSAPVKLGMVTTCGAGDGGTLRWTGTALEVCDGAGGWLPVGGSGSGMSIVGVSPTSGTVLGGTGVTLLGTGFGSGTTVTFDGVASPLVTVQSATQILAMTPPGVEGFANVAVARGTGSALVTNAFRYKDPSVKLHLRFDTAGVVATDDSISAHPVTIDGAAAATNAGGQAQGDGTFANALATPNASGQADGARVPNHSDWDFGTGDFTLEAWVKPTGYGSTGQGGILSTNDWTQNTASQGIVVRFDGSSSSRILVHNSNLSLYLTSTNSVPLNQWSHVAVTRQSDVFRIFINGALDPTTATYRGAVNSQGQGLTIGRSWFGYTTHGWQGYLDEIRVTKGWARYDASFSVPAGPLGQDGVGGVTLRQVSPWAGSITGGTTVTLTGTGFEAGMGVSIGGQAATVLSVPDSRSATVLAPAHAEGAVAVALTASGGTASRAAAFAYRDPAVKLHLRANNPGGLGFFDDSLSAFAVTREGAAAQNTAAGFPASNQLFQSALYTPNPSGVADGLRLTPSSDWDFGTGAFTIEAWLKPTGYGTSGHGGIFTTNEYNSNTVANGIVLRYYGTDGRVYMHNQNSSQNYISSFTMPLNQWSHLALVRSGNVFRWYLNGTPDTTPYTHAGACNSQGSGALVGRSWFNYPQHGWQGYIDELRVTKGVARYTASFTPPAAPFE